MRNAYNNLSKTEYISFVKEHKSQKIGARNRDNEMEMHRAEKTIQKLTNKTFNMCGFCGIHCSHVNLKKCGKCLNQLYCSVKCQTSDWKTHKKTCVKHT